MGGGTPFLIVSTPLKGVDLFVKLIPAFGGDIVVNQITFVSNNPRKTEINLLK